tara:strand:+ start:5232 stop:5471 length:240 start_codon:yes stop_codon:yes gene_type:complete
MTSKLLSANELAEVLNIAVWTVYEHAKSGKIPHYRVGRSLRFSLEDVLNTYKPEKRSVDAEERLPKPKGRYQPFDWSST